MSENRDTFRHAAIYSLATVLGKAVGFLLLPLYAHVFRDLGYGIIAMMDAGLGFLASLIGYMIRGGVVRIYHEEEGEDKLAVISTCMIMLWVGMTAIVLLILPFARPISAVWLGDPGNAPYLMLALAAFLVEITGQAAGILLIIRQRSTVFSSIGLLRLLVGIGLNIWLIVVLRMGLTGYFLASLGMHLVGSTAFHIIGLRRCGLRYDARIARKLIAFQLPLVPGNILSFLARQAERVLLRFLVTLESVGVLEMAYKFPGLISLFITQPFMQSWNTKRTEIAERPGAPEQIGRMFTYYLFLMLFAGLILSVDMDPLIKLMTPPEFWAAIGIAHVVILTEILVGCHRHLMFGVYYAKDTRLLNRIRSTVAVGKLAISFALIYFYGLAGAAYSSAVSALVLATWTGRASRRYYRMVLEWRRIAVLGGSAVLLAWAIQHFDVLRTLGLERLDRTLTPRLVDWLQSGFLGTWRHGAVPRMLQGRSILLYELTARTLAAGLFLLLLPVVHEGARRRLASLVRWRRPSLAPGPMDRPVGPAPAELPDPDPPREWP